jgi:hypothetical protein
MKKPYKSKSIFTVEIISPYDPITAEDLEVMSLLNSAYLKLDAKMVQKKKRNHKPIQNENKTN